MKIPRIRFNPLTEGQTGDSSVWMEIAVRLIRVRNAGKKLNPKNINDALDEIDGLIEISGNGATLLNEDGDFITRDRGDRSESISAVIRKLGRITNKAELKNYSLGNTYKTKTFTGSSYSKPFQQSSFGGSSLPQQPYVPPPKTYSYGGVVIRDDGMVMVVEPANHFSGMRWTFPKGGIDEGETPEIAGLREVKEESGWDAQIIAKIEGSYEGTTTITEYFLMKPIGVQGQWQYQGTSKEETWQVAFVPYDCARLLVATSSNKKARDRDIEVLDKAYELWLSIKG